jgi:MFS family permease
VSDSVVVAVGCVLAALGALRATWSPCGQSMLASLNPLSERARGSSWHFTAGAFAIGACTGGLAGGVALGSLGSLLPAGTDWRGAALLAVLAVAVLVDATPLRRRLPLTRRQVNEDWMARYRGWVYGFGYGAQLGLGFTTLVACAAVYGTFAAEILSGGPLRAGLIGLVFGAVKAACLAPARSAGDPVSLRALHRRLIALDVAAERLVITGELLAILITVAGAVS